MAINQNLMNSSFLREKNLRRPSDRNLFLAAAILFPLLVLIGYFRTYYFSAFFDVKPLANALVHAHGIVMSLWVVYFTAQTVLIRSKNIRLHMTLGMAGIVLAAIVVIVGLATAYDAHVVRATAPPGLNPHSFLIVPVVDMLLFVIFFGGAIYYRKRPAEHKTLMLMTAINFVGAAVARIPFFPQNFILLFVIGIPILLAIISLVWCSVKYRKLNRIFAAAVFLFIVSIPLRIVFANTAIWLDFVGWLAS
jgi:hypothetical protein